jgi:hypothetical protein
VTALLSLLLVQTAPMTDQPVFQHGVMHRHWGQVELTFEVPADTRAIELRFAQRLDGMRVEAQGGDGHGRSVPLQPERRVGGSVVQLQWKAEGIREVTVVLHHHLRDDPVVIGWSLGGKR